MDQQQNEILPGLMPKIGARRLRGSEYVRWGLLSLGSGVLSGLAAAAFLALLDFATRYRDANPVIIWALPLAGLAIGLIYHRFGRNVAAGNSLIIDEIHDPKKVVPLRMAPFILLGTVVTHLFGGSAGREGTAVQMGASLSDQLSLWFRVKPEERRILLAAGAGAGFGAAIGAPFSGVIFGMEVIAVGRLRLFAWFECLIASFAGFYTTELVHAPHSVYPRIAVPGFEPRTALAVAVAGAIFGLAALCFARIAHAVEHVQARLFRFPPLRPFCAGLALVVLYYLEASYRYAGLGIPVIQQALQEPATFRDPLYKVFFTALTVGSGFKGGEFIPLVFIGTTLGSALGGVLSAPFSLLAAVGFAAVFGGAANTPIACSLMAMELFGWRIAPYALLGCFASYYFSGHKGIYGAQRIHGRKHALLWQRLRVIVKRLRD